jgi:hypothetical protein
VRGNAWDYTPTPNVRRIVIVVQISHLARQQHLLCIFPSTNMFDQHVHSQHESKLLSMPVEIRQAIYAQTFHGQTHAFLSQGRIHLSVCLQPNLGDDRHDGRERVTTTHWRQDDPGWARRLRSTWGVHWECEEAAYTERADLHERRRYHTYDLFFVCKKM